MMSVLNRNMEMCKLLIDNGAVSSINTTNKVNIKSYVDYIHMKCIYMLVLNYLFYEYLWIVDCV
jgi:hypothetical protein